MSNGSHPWRSTQAGTNHSWSSDSEDGYHTSAFWLQGVLHTVGEGKPYADYIEYVARMESKLYGKWTGLFCPREFQDSLKQIGAL